MSPIWRHFIWPLSLPVPDSSPTGFVARGRSRHGHFRGQRGGAFGVVAVDLRMDGLVGSSFCGVRWGCWCLSWPQTIWKDLGRTDAHDLKMSLKGWLSSFYLWTSQGPNFELDLFSQKVPWNHLPVMVLRDGSAEGSCLTELFAISGFSGLMGVESSVDNVCQTTVM